MEQKFRVGDRIYPIEENALRRLGMNNVDVKDFVGIIIEADRKINGNYEYSITWLNWKRTNELYTLWNSWWKEDQLTLNRKTFLKLVKDYEPVDDFDWD